MAGRFTRAGRRRALSARRAIALVAEMRLARYYTVQRIAARYKVSTKTARSYFQRSEEGLPL